MHAPIATLPVHVDRHVSPTRTGAWILLALPCVPLLWSLWGAASTGLDTVAWAALAHDPQTLRAAGLSLWTGLCSTALALLVCAWTLSYRFAVDAGNARHSRMPWLAAMLSVPHAAFAIGLAALLAPAGWLLRALSPWASGLQSPPAWATTQDPWGLGLIAVLVLKEAPYLLWIANAHLQQPDVATRLRREHALACTLGYSPGQAWWRVVWPQVLCTLPLPCLAVLAYGLSTVDMALVIGPTSPPTLAVLAWHWLQDADPATNAQGAAAAWTLLGLTGICALAGQHALNLRLWRRQGTRGWQAALPLAPRQPTAALHLLLPAVYVVVLGALAAGSVTGVWPFPALLPHSWTSAAWQSVWFSREVLVTTCTLAWGSAATALVWSVAWLEWAPARWQARVSAVFYLPLALPSVLWVLGLHRMFIGWGWDATARGLWLAHTLACVPYVLLGIQASYRRFDPRLQSVAASLGCSRTAFLWRVKWPLLRATLASGFAMGFAVSVAQYLPTLYVGAGRFATVTTEALGLAAGGQRSLASAFAWLQWLLPALVFSLAALLGRPRRFSCAILCP